MWGMGGGDTGIIGEDGRTGLPDITKILGKEDSGTGMSSNRMAKIRKTQN